METYFHLSQALLAPGSVIENGNFGRMLDRYTPGGEFDISLLYREEVFEFIRLTKYADKPSRLLSIFLLKNLEEAFQYMMFNAKNHNLYEVEIIDTSKPVHEGAWCPPFPFGGSLRKYTYDYASLYWSGSILSVTTQETTVFPREIIVESPVRVLRRIPSPLP